MSSELQQGSAWYRSYQNPMTRKNVPLPDQKLRVFWFHLNKPASRAQAIPVWSLHWGGKCELVYGIKCNAPIETRPRKTQPIAIVHGRASHVHIHYGDGGKREAWIYA